MIQLPARDSYLADKESFRLAVPEDFNFGFDVIAARAAEADKTAFIFVDRSGEKIEPHSFGELDRQANRFAHVLLGLGAAKGDHALVMMPRVPAWYEVLIGCIKLGVVAMPATIQLTAKDIAYRINKSRAKFAVLTSEHAPKLEQIRGECPTLAAVIVSGEERPGCVHYEWACGEASQRLERGDLPPTLASDPMLIYFTSGTTSMPKMVPRDQSYALAHIITGHYWMDLREEDTHWTLSDTGWAKAAWGMLFPQWLVGATVVLYDGD
ncbi:MAG: AMP-binding protein, partial [bacterium]